MKKLSHTTEQIPQTYDDLYTSGGYKRIYNLPFWRSQYYPLYSAVVKQLLANTAILIMAFYLDFSKI